jgi:hypothetical protein
MILSNVNIGSGPSTGDGDPLRSAFSTINTNFQKITNNVNALSNSVTSVAGRTGSVVLTINDILGWSTIVTQSNINATVNTANIGMLGYVDSKIAANIATLINSAPGALDTLQELAAALGNNSSFASTITNSLATTNSNLIVANTTMKGYVDGQVLAANTGIASAVTLANTGIKGYVDQANTIQSAQIASANVGIIGYIDQANSIQSSQLTQANLGIIGYIDQANTIQSAQITSANVGIIGYIDQANTIQSAQIISANVGMKGYVDAVTAAWTANAQAQENLLANIGALDLNNINATLGVHNGQINDLIANAGVQAGSIADLYANAAVQAALISSLGNTAQIQSNIAVLQSNAATQSDLIIRINSNVTQANLGMVGYVSSTVVTANVGMKGYVDSQIISVNTGANANITTANVGMKGYVDSINTILTANAVSQGANISLLLSSVGSLPGQIVSANLGMKGYVDSLTATYSNINVQSYLVTNSYATQDYVNTSNTSMKTYVDGQIAAVNVSITSANVGLKGYVDQANLGMKGYVDSVAGQSNYANANVAAYLLSYAGNIAVNTIKFDDLSEQRTAYTGTQWRSNLTSDLTVKPTWMSYYPGLKNQLDTQYGFDSNGMFFSGNADNDIAYPIRTNLHIHGEDTTEIIVTINFANTIDDHGIAIFNSTSVPVWRYATDATRIAFQFSSGTPRLYGQTTQDVSGTPVVTAGNDYTIKFVYNPSNTVTVYTYDGPDTTGTLLDTRTINEVLPAGDYIIGFDADQDGIGAKSYFTNVIIRTLTNTVVNNLEVQGRVTGDLIPSANVTYDLGNVTHRWRDLWLSGSTLHIGNANISVSNGSIQSSAPIRADITGNVTASNITITGNTLTIGGATLDVVGGAIQSSLPITSEGPMTATNLSITGTQLQFAQGSYIEESEVVGMTGTYALALNSPDDGFVGLNALDSNASVTSSVIVSNVLVQVNVANSTPGGNALIWAYGSDGALILPAGGIITTPDAQEFQLQAKDTDSLLRNEINLDPNNGTYMSVWSEELDTAFSADDWDTASWVNEGGSGAAYFANAENLQDFWTTGIGSIVNSVEVSINGGARTLVEYDGNDGEQYGVLLLLGAVPVSSPTTITSLTFYYRTKNSINIDYDNGQMRLEAQSMNITLETSNELDLRSGEILTLMSTGQSPVRIYTDSTTNMWEFNSTGSLTLPQEGKIFGLGLGPAGPRGGYVSWAGNTSAGELGFNTIRLVPDEVLETFDQYIILDPTYVDGEPGSISIRAGGTQDNSLTHLYLGGANSHVKISAGLNSPVTVMSNNNSWDFGNTGNLTLPAGGTITEGVVTDNPTIELTPANPDDASQKLVIKGGLPPEEPADYHLHLTTGDLDLTSIILGTDYHNVRTTTDGKIQITTPTEGTNVWEFDTTGALTFPDDTVQTTAWTGILPNPTYSGSDQIGQATPAPLNLNNSAEATLLTQLNLINTGGGAGSGSAIDFWTYTSINDVPEVRLQAVDDGDYSADFAIKIKAKGESGFGNLTTTWTFGTDGNLTLPAGGDILDSTGNVYSSYSNVQVASYLPTYTGNISAGNVYVPGTSGKIGYSLGGFVQQTTSNATGVTSHFSSGNIQLMSIDLGVNSAHTVAFSCNKLTTNDMLLVQHISGGVTSVHVSAYVMADGLAIIWMRDITGVGTGAFTPMLKYAIVRAPSS